MRKTCCILFVVLGFLQNRFHAQQTILSNQSAYNLFQLNPAIAGSGDLTAVNCNYKKNWTMLGVSPELTFFSADGNFNSKRCGTGIQLSNERAGIFLKQYINATYCYRLRVGRTQYLAMGVNSGFQRYSVDYSRIKADKPEEFSNEYNNVSLLPDAALGIAFLSESFICGISANQFLSVATGNSQRITNHSLLVQPIPFYQLVVRNTFNKQKKNKFVTQLTARSTHGLALQADLSFHWINHEKFNIGTGVRQQFAAYSVIGVNISERFSVRYSYEYSHEIQNNIGAGHELGLTFKISETKSAPTPVKEKNPGIADELLEKISGLEQHSAFLNEKVDSLNSHIQKLEQEIAELLRKQISLTDIEKNTNRINIDSGNTAEGENGKFSREFYIIRDQKDSTEATRHITKSNELHIVFGVYQLENYAQRFADLIKSQTGKDTELFVLPGHPNRYIYVCLKQTYNTLKPAFEILNTIRADFSNRPTQLTNGLPWILQVNK